MADLEKSKLLIDDKLTEDVHTIVSFLDPHLSTPSKTKSPDKTALWSWRKMIAFVLITSVIGWSLVLGVIYLLTRLWD